MQYNAHIVLVEVGCSNEEEWRRRLTARGSQDANTCRQHKPGSYEDVVAIIKRNNGSEEWSKNVDVACHLHIDMASPSSSSSSSLELPSSSVQYKVEHVIQTMKNAGLSIKAMG